MKTNVKMYEKSQMNIGIHSIKVTIYNNLGKQVDLNAKMFVFQEKSASISDANENPYLSTNIEYNTKKLNKMTHSECVQTFFNKKAFIRFLKNEPIIDYDIQTSKNENETIQQNVQIMLEYIFPMSFPVIRTLKRKSDAKMLGFTEAFKKEFFKRKYNTFLNVGGKTNTVDGVTILDTFSTNPRYLKAYDAVSYYKQQLVVAFDDLFPKIEKKYKEYIEAIRILKDATTEFVNNKSDKSDAQLQNTIEKEIFQTRITFENIKTAVKIEDITELITMNVNLKRDFNNNYKILRDKIVTIQKKIKEFESLVKEVKTFFDAAAISKNMSQKIKEYSAKFTKLSDISEILKFLNIAELLSYVSHSDSYIKKKGIYRLSAEVDLKKYGFYEKVIGDMREYYFPKRESINAEIKKIFNSGENGNEIDIVAIDTTYNDSTKTTQVDIDKIDLNNENRNNPRYNIQVQLSIFGGMVTDNVKKYIKCKYEERKNGEDIYGYNMDLDQSGYFDLSSDISKIEKEHKSDDKQKKENVENRAENIIENRVQNLVKNSGINELADGFEKNYNVPIKNQTMELSDKSIGEISLLFQISNEEKKNKKLSAEEEKRRKKNEYVPYVELKDVLEKINSDAQLIEIFNFIYDPKISDDFEKKKREIEGLYITINGKLDIEKNQLENSMNSPIIKSNADEQEKIAKKIAIIAKVMYILKTAKSNKNTEPYKITGGHKKSLQKTRRIYKNKKPLFRASHKRRKY
jgi:hypothetical protein